MELCMWPTSLVPTYGISFNLSTSEVVDRFEFLVDKHQKFGLIFTEKNGEKNLEIINVT